MVREEGGFELGLTGGIPRRRRRRVSAGIPAGAAAPERAPVAAKTQVTSGRKFLFLVRPQNFQGLGLIDQSPIPAGEEKGLEFLSNFFPTGALHFFVTQGPQLQTLGRHFFSERNQFLAKSDPQFLKGLNLFVIQVQFFRPGFEIRIQGPG
jgi:hypothetical protein